VFSASRRFMRENAGRKVPEDYRMYSLSSLSHTHTHTHARFFLSLSLSLRLSLLLIFCFNDFSVFFFDFAHAHTHTRTHAHVYRYPGKMDHTTCICLRIGDFSEAKKAYEGGGEGEEEDNLMIKWIMKNEWVRVCVWVIVCFCVFIRKRLWLRIGDFSAEKRERVMELGGRRRGESR